MGRGDGEGTAAAALGRQMLLGQWSRVSTLAGQVVVARLVVPVTVGREGSKRSVVAAGSGRTRTTGWTLEGDPPRHRQRGPGQRLVAVAVEPEGQQGIGGGGGFWQEIHRDTGSGDRGGGGGGGPGGQQEIGGGGGRGDGGVAEEMDRDELMIGVEGPVGLQAPSDELTRRSGWR